MASMVVEVSGTYPKRTYVVNLDVTNNVFEIRMVFPNSACSGTNSYGVPDVVGLSCALS